MDKLRTEIHDMSEKIYQLQEKTEHLTNGQRYAAINEIEKSLSPLKKDLHNLQYELYEQKHEDEALREKINVIFDQINELENIKSDLIRKINTENEHTKKEFNDKIISFMKEELSPIQETIEENRKDMKTLSKDMETLRIELIKVEKDREIAENKKFDKLKMTITGVVAFLVAFSTLSTFFEPTIKVLVHVLFGT